MTISIGHTSWTLTSAGVHMAIVVIVLELVLWGLLVRYLIRRHRRRKYF